MTPLSELHYFEVDMGEAANDLRAALLIGLHGFNESHANDLGVDFSGTSMRVFGAEAPLRMFFEQPRTQRLVAVCEKLTPPARVPASTQGVAVTRHRPASRNQGARVRRFERRNPGVVLPAAKTIRCDLAIALSSKSTKQDFLLKLARRSAPLSETVVFNSYGLCAPGASVPSF